MCTIGMVELVTSNSGLTILEFERFPNCLDSIYRNVLLLVFEFSCEKIL